MPAPPSDRDRQIAELAVELGYLKSERLASVLNEDLQNRSLLDVLVDRGWLKEEQRAELTSLFDQESTASLDEGADSVDDPLFAKLQGALSRAGDLPPDPKPAGSDDDPFAETMTAYGDRSGRFAIIREHAQGGLGEVLLAEDQQLHRHVAVKQIREEWADHPGAQERFLQEAEITGRLEHPGIVPVHALGTRPDGRAYYAMRFIRGDSLEDATRKYHSASTSEADETEHTLELRQLITRFIDVCNTISYAHSRGIIHRDLKPANIMLGKYGETLVVDWGLAKAVGETESRSTKADSLITPGSGSGSTPTTYGSAVGTPQYMSPEQATGRVDRIGPASDIYCLGATLYHVLTGTPPIVEDSLDRILDRVEHGDVKPAHEVDEDVPEPLSAICRKAMSVRPTDRYKTAMDLAADLERWLADEPVPVYQEPLLARLGRWTRRNRVLATSSVLTIVLLGLAAVGGSLIWNHFHDQKLRQDLEIARREQQRLAELTASTQAAEQLADDELQSGRFATALNILEQAADELQDEAQLADRREHLEERADELRRIVTYYYFVEAAEQANFQNREAEAAILLFQAMEAIGGLEYGDWWAHLPDDQLTPEQFDDLRRSVYSVLISMAGIYTKQTGAKLIGPDGAVSRHGLFRTLISRAGKDEAQAALIACDLANRFRVSQAVRWYRGRMGRRFSRNYYVSPSDLGPPANARDANAMTLLNLIGALSPDFEFSGYLGEDDPLVAAYDTMHLALELEPDYYWHSLSLGHITYLLAQRAVDDGDPDAWRQIDAARQLLGRSIAVRPNLPFAYADTSTGCLHQAEALAKSSNMSEAEIRRRTKELHRLSLMNAEKAVDLAPDAAWVYWHLGQSLNAVGQVDKAVDAFLTAIERDHRLTNTADSLLIDVDDLRGRQRAIDLATRLAEANPDEPRYRLLEAAGYFSDSKFGLAQSSVERCLKMANVPAMAWALRGMMALDEEQYQSAEAAFSEAHNLNESSIWAAYGLARCHEAAGDLSSALDMYQRGYQLSITDDHRGACELGRCRTLLRLGREIEAIDSLKSAKVWQPSCILKDVIEIAKDVGADQLLAEIGRLPSMSPRPLLENERLTEFRVLPVLNAGFELELNRYWGNPDSLTWMNTPDCESTARVTPEEKHNGVQSLRIQYGADQRIEGGFGQTTQTMPSSAETQYRITLWAKASDLATRAVRVVINENWDSPVIELPAGSYDWTEFTGEFVTPEGDPSTKDETLVLTTIRIISAGPGTVWLDDIEVATVTDE